MTKKEDGTFTMGGFLGILGLYCIAFPHDLQAGFFLLGIGVVLMASSSEERRQQLFGFFLSTLKETWHFVYKWL